MKIPRYGVKCLSCKENIHAITFPCGADYVTCPLCENFLDWKYCPDCKIVFKTGCTHAVNA